LRRALTFALSVSLGATALGGGVARAQQRPALRFKVGLWPDAALVTAGVSLTAVPLLWPNSFPRATCAPCDRSGLWSLDRGAIGPQGRTADVLSYATLGAEAALGTLFLARSRRGQPGAAFFEDATVIAEAVSLTEAVTEWTKVLVHRPRPYRYTAAATGTASADDGRSFPSSHASVAFAAAAAYASLLHRRGLAGRNKLEIGLLFAAATATSVLRVAAHKHFPTDVAAGAALGFAIGWTLPAIHVVSP
jgi:membrane-associated phospholipid phosphatase